MASLVPTLLKAIKAQDDEFVKSIVEKDVFSDEGERAAFEPSIFLDIKKAVETMDERSCSIFFEVLVSLLVRHPINNKSWKWLKELEKTAPSSSVPAQALATLREYEKSLQPRLQSVHALATDTLQQAIETVQRQALREVKADLARATAASEPLIRYKVKH